MELLVRKTPQNFVENINDEIRSLLNRRLDNYFPEADYFEEMDKLSMPVEITDKGKNYEVKAELPGVKKENLDIDIDQNYLTIKAKKEEEESSNKDNYKKSEFRYGEYTRTVCFPEEIDTEKTEAKLEHGILKIEAPKKHIEQETRKKLMVK